MNTANAPTLCAGIACFNRERLYYHTLDSLRESQLQADVIVFDDASTTIDHKITLGQIPSAQVFVNKANSGRADFAMRMLMSLFLQHSKSDYLLFLDSDLQISQALTDTLAGLLSSKAHDGVFSIFNTPSHPGESLNETWLIKKSIGAAGAVLSRSWVEKILEKVPPSTQYDWDWSNFIWRSNKKILCTKRSYVQHLGFGVGQNSRYRIGDYGVNFEAATPKQLTLILEEMHATLKSQRDHQLQIQNRLESYVSKQG